MAIRSPSPNPSRPTTHNPRTPESAHSLRKSKDILHRSSLSNSSAPNLPSTRASNEQKENMKARSPSILSSKGSKNFMAPTISAASKAVITSPRKKILQERNEVINSVSNSLEFLEKGGSVEVEEIALKSGMGFGSQDASGVGEVKKVESKIKNHRNVIVPLVSPSSVISPMDAEPSLPPYDPKTNYLSPRPQFLHYRPNPRIEQYLSKEGEFPDVGDGRRLEDSFSSENGEDDVTVLTKEKDSEEEPFLTEVKEVEHPSEATVSELQLKLKTLKHRPMKGSKLVSFLFVLVVASLYVPLSDTPIISSSMLKDQSLQKVYSPPFGIFEDLHLRNYFFVANGNIHCLASRLKHWATDSIAYFTSATSYLKDDVGSYPLVNMTPSAVDEAAGLDLSYKHETETGQVIKENEIAELSLSGPERELSLIVKEDDAKYNAETENTEIEDTINDTVRRLIVSEDVKEDDGGAQRIEMEVYEYETDADTVGDEMEKGIIVDGRKELESEASQSYEPPHIEEVAENTEILVEAETTGDEDDRSDANPIYHAQPYSYVDYQSGFNKEYQNSIGLELLNLMNYRTTLGLPMALLVLVFAATLVFLNMKHKQVPLVRKETQATKKVGSFSGSGETYIHATGSPSQNLQVKEGMIGDSGPSELSYSRNSISSSGLLQTNRDKEEQNLSHDRRLRRDSVSSSISYGSFTTYEKLSARKGGRDEEVVTPVRRSSRIRNIVTSP